MKIAPVRRAVLPEGPARLDWASGPPRVELQPETVHVWRADLESVPAGLLELLSDEEAVRARQILPPRARRLWPRCRALLRVLLARYLACEPGAIALITGPEGKPALAERSAGLHFNLSHSGGAALFALARRPVGIDLECSRREAALLRAWTRREAAAKLHGRGLGSSAPIGQAPWVAELHPGVGAAALALERAPAELQGFELR